MQKLPLVNSKCCSHTVHPDKGSLQNIAPNCARIPLCMYSDSLQQQLLDLLNAGVDGEVNVLVSDINDHSADNGRLHLQARQHSSKKNWS